MRVETVRLVVESEFSELVRQTYGRPYQLQQQGDCLGQGTMLRFTVPSEADPDWHGGPSLAEWMSLDPDFQPERVSAWESQLSDFTRTLWWERKFYPDTQEVLNDLHARGLMEAGDYVIHVWW